jgi:hypothetical protein
MVRLYSGKSMNNKKGLKGYLEHELDTRYRKIDRLYGGI